MNGMYIWKVVRKDGTYYKTCDIETANNMYNREGEKMYAIDKEHLKPTQILMYWKPMKAKIVGI